MNTSVRADPIPTSTLCAPLRFSQIGLGVNNIMLHEMNNSITNVNRTWRVCVTVNVVVLFRVFGKLRDELRVLRSRLLFQQLEIVASTCSSMFANLAAAGANNFAVTNSGRTHCGWLERWPGSRPSSLTNLFHIFDALLQNGHHVENELNLAFSGCHRMQQLRNTHGTALRYHAR